jgi:hypothetical protein
MKVSHWIFARYAPYKSIRLLFPSKEGRLMGAFIGEATGPQFSKLNSQI